MKKLATLCLFLALSAVTCAYGADKPDASAAQEKAGQASESARPDADNAAEQGDGKKSSAQSEEKKEDPREFSCQYYKVTLPEGWKAVLAPTERQGNINAIFARSDDRTLIAFIVGSGGDGDTEMIANMFAEQLKAAKPPVKKDGQYVFSYGQTDASTGQTKTVHACVATQGNEFMVTTWYGDSKEVREFLKNSITSEKYSDLLPK